MSDLYEDWYVELADEYERSTYYEDEDAYEHVDDPNAYVWEDWSNSGNGNH